MYPGEDVNRTSTDRDSQARRSHADQTRLLAFSVVLLLAGLGLALVAGPPRWPSAPPRLDGVLHTLSGVTLPLVMLSLILVDLAWLVWTWSVL